MYFMVKRGDKRVKRIKKKIGAKVWGGTAKEKIYNNWRKG